MKLLATQPKEHPPQTAKGSYWPIAAGNTAQATFHHQQQQPDTPWLLQATLPKQHSTTNNNSLRGVAHPNLAAAGNTAQAAFHQQRQWPASRPLPLQASQPGTPVEDLNPSWLRSPHHAALRTAQANFSKTTPFPLPLGVATEHCLTHIAAKTTPSA
jgi:hypothetical protein